ncbi:MAG: diguanylate cyclase [Sulfuricurvum sp.]|nr:diguanylate cyclase [Sulfuricurvum sp.]
MRKIVFAVVLSLLFPFYAIVQAKEPKQEAVIGVLAFRSKTQTLQEWEPLASYLDSRIPTHHFIIRPLSYAEFNEAAKADELDFAFTNPEHYIYLSAKYNVSRMATLIRAKVEGKALTEFGGVILARSNRSDIKDIDDLRGKKIAAVDELSLGGYLAQRVMLNENGIDIAAESDIRFTDMPHDKVVYLVQKGLADAGFVRTGLLEKMAKEGKIRRSDFKIIHPVSDGFPLALSTALYPEWPFSSSKKADRILANQVGVALLNLPHGSQIAGAAGYCGWNIPLSYEGIRDMMQRLRIKPYDTPPKFSFKDVIRQYDLIIMIGLGMIILFLIVISVKMRRLSLSSQNQSNILKEQLEIIQKNENKLRLSSSVFHNSQDGIIIADAQKVIIDVNEAFTALTGYEKEEVIGKKPIILRSGVHLPSFYLQMNEDLETRGTWRGEIWNRKKNGELYAQFLRIDSVYDSAGKLENYIGIVSDVTENKKEQELLQHLANYDPLTNIPNRHLFMSLAEQMVALSKRKDTKTVIAFLDLDGFKPINDQYGHDMGDVILKKVAARLGEQMRESDTVARMGGDEFILLMSDVKARTEVRPLLERILKALQEPFFEKGITIKIGASIGVAFYPDDGEDIETLIRYADSAMYRSKDEGRNRITYYDCGCEKKEK